MSPQVKHIHRFDMGRILSKGSGLTESQKKKAGLMKLSNSDMMQYVLGGLQPFIRGQKFTDTGGSSHDVLVIGGGPSIKNHIKVVKRFKGIICVIDNIADYVAENGVSFDYMVSLEKGWQSLRIIFDKGKKLQKIRDQFTLVYSGTATYISHLMEVYESICDNLLRFDATYQHVANVGLYGIQFAEEHLKAKRIFLIGFDNHGTDIDGNAYGWEIFMEWQAEFKHFMVNGIKAEIINCTPRSKLIDERMQVGTIKDLKMRPCCLAGACPRNGDQLLPSSL